MSIDSVTEMWSRQTGGVASPDGKQYSASFSSAYQVVHSAGATTAEILSAIPVKLNDGYPGFAGVYCDKIGDRQPSGPILSIVPVSYSGETGANGDSPLNMDPVIRYYSSTSTEPADTDGNGVPYTNVNGELVDGITRDISDMVLTVQRNFAAVSGMVALQYMDSVNSDPFNVFGDVWLPGQVALQEFSIDPVIVQGAIEYFSVSARLSLRQSFNTYPYRAWWARYRNEGLKERVGTRVTFGAPGGEGKTAYGYPIVSGGAVTAIAVTCAGSGYASAPTVTITDATGTGAAATAVLSSGRVSSVTIGTGGSGYKTSLIRAVDSSGEPETQPILLKTNGEREKNASAATWIERPKKTYTLPYSALGLL